MRKFVNSYMFNNNIKRARFQIIFTNLILCNHQADLVYQDDVQFSFGSQKVVWKELDIKNKKVTGRQFWNLQEQGYLISVKTVSMVISKFSTLLILNYE